jgi:hypothetical protein
MTSFSSRLIMNEVMRLVLWDSFQATEVVLFFELGGN